MLPLLRALYSRGRLLPLLREAAAEQSVVSAAREAGLAASLAELQVAADAFRRRHGLDSADATWAWLAREDLNLADLEDALERDLLIVKFKDHLAAGRGPEHFEANRARYDRVRLRRLVAPSEEAARELCHQVEHDGAEFADLAGRHDPDPAARASGGALGALARWQLPAAVAEAVFAARAGAVAGPVPVDGGFALYLVEELLPADPADGPTAARIRDELFVEWLADRLKDVRIDLGWLSSPA